MAADQAGLAEQIRHMISEGNAALRSDIKQDMLNEMMKIIDTKVEESAKAMETKIMAAVQALGERTRTMEAQLREITDSENENERKRRALGSVSTRSTRSMASTATAHKDGVDPQMVWCLGFPRDLLAQTLKDFVGDIVKKMMPLDTVYTVRAYNLENRCAICFGSVREAHSFLERVRDATTEFENAKLRFRPDRSAEARQRNKVLGGLWQGLTAKIDTTGAKKIGQNGPKGKVFVADASAGKVWIIYTLDHAHRGRHRQLQGARTERRRCS